jgi:hypothetical protein
MLYKGKHCGVFSLEQVGEGRACASNGRDESDARRSLGRELGDLRPV